MAASWDVAWCVIRFCGMHVDETLSIPFRDEGELLYFCSLACRDAYTESTKKFAANG